MGASADDGIARAEQQRRSLLGERFSLRTWTAGTDEGDQRRARNSAPLPKGWRAQERTRSPGSGKLRARCRKNLALANELLGLRKEPWAGKNGCLGPEASRLQTGLG